MIKKLLIIICLVILMGLAGNTKNGLVNARCSTDECDLYSCGNDEVPACHNIPANCLVGIEGTCGCDTVDYFGGCSIWNEWSSCYNDGGSCQQARSCRSPSIGQWQYRSCSGCGSVTPPLDVVVGMVEVGTFTIIAVM